MIYLGVLLLGVISWFRLPQELLPALSYPQLTIVTYYKDAAPEEIELLVTKPIEEAVGTVAGLKRISSTSREELSIVIAEFAWGRNMDFAALGAREKIDLIKEKLPRGSEDPIVMKYNPFQLPVIVANIVSSAHRKDFLSFVKKAIKQELEKVDGVAQVSLAGGKEREIQVELNYRRLQASETSIVSVNDVLAKANLNYPAGTIKEAFYEYLIRTMGEFKLVSEIPQLPVRVERYKEEGEDRLEQLRAKDTPEKSPQMILLKDVAEIKDAYKETTSISRFNRLDNISMSIQKQAGVGTIFVADNVKKALAKIKTTLPEDVTIDIVYDESSFIRNSLAGVRDAGWQGGVLAFFVLFYFLNSFWYSFIVATTIPISVIATFALMYFFGISINLISLGGLALGIGMLVDNAIVVVENIFTHRQRLGEDAKTSAARGAQEVWGAIGASTLTTVAVFLPMIYVVGIAGQIFKELAFTVTFSLMVSLITAVMLVPLLSTWRAKGGTLSFGEDKPFIKRFSGVIEKILQFFLKKSWLALGAIFLLFAVALYSLNFVNKEFLPKVDQGQFVIRVELPPGARIEMTDSVVRHIEDVLFSLKETKNVSVRIGSSKERSAGELVQTLGSHQAEIIVNLKPRLRGIARFFGQENKDVRLRSTSDVIQTIKNALSIRDTKGATIEYIVQETMFRQAFVSGAPIVIEVKGHDLDTLKQITRTIESRLGSIEGAYGIKDNIVLPSPETKITINKERAALYGFSVSDIALVAQTALKGYVPTKFKEEGDEIDIRVRLRKEDRDSFSKIRNLALLSPTGARVPLAELAYIYTGKGPTEIYHQDQQRTVLISCYLYKRKLSDVLKEVEHILATAGVPKGFSASLGGENENIKESFASLQFALIISIILVYMIMASQFESLWQPFIIIMTIPLSIIGVVASLLLTGHSLNVMVILGVIILGGVVVNNGIVLIDFINLIRKEGVGIEEAIKQGSKVRLRPILMTALTTILGLIPLALGLGEGSEIQAPMAATIIGGLSLSTLLTLVVIPTLYFKVYALFEKRRGPEEKTPHALMPLPQEHKEVVSMREKVAPREPSVPSREAPQEAKSAEEKAPDAAAQLSVSREEEKKEEKMERLESILEKEDTQALYDALPERQRALLRYLENNARITRKDYAELFNISVPTAARDLKELLVKGLIEGKGPLGKGRYYELVRKRR
jgi:HAE1 family hydrophobic/amphiphilic exporter-1